MLKRSSGTWLLLLRKVDLAELLLVLLDIVVQRHEETLSVLWSHNDAAANLRLLHTWKHASEVEDKVARRVSDECEVSVNAYTDFRLQFNLKSLGLLVVVFFHFYFMFRFILNKVGIRWYTMV